MYTKEATAKKAESNTENIVAIPTLKRDLLITNNTEIKNSNATTNTTINIQKSGKTPNLIISDTAIIEKTDNVESKLADKIDVLEAKLTSVDRKNVKLGVSVKAYEIEEEKKAIEEYTNTQSSGSTLGDALGEALKNKE